MSAVLRQQAIIGANTYERIHSVRPVPSLPAIPNERQNDFRLQLAKEQAGVVPLPARSEAKRRGTAYTMTS